MSELIAAARCLLMVVLAAVGMFVGFSSAHAARPTDHPAGGARRCPPWRVGLASMCITPEGPIRMAGYSGRKEPSESVLGDLYAKAVAIEDTDGQRAVLITADLIGFRGSLAELICDSITEKTGLARPQIMLCPSHTHAGPVLGFKEANRYELPEDQLNVVEQYTKRVVQQLIDLAAAAVADLKPAKLSSGTGVADFVMNRREFTDRGILLGVNPSGYVDRSVPVLRVDSPDGKLRAVVFGCACHNTTCTGKNLQICGDYAGFAQQAIEKRHPGVQAMFVIGCGGDANPYPRGTTELAIQHGNSLAVEVCRVLETELKPVGGPLRVELAWVNLPLASVPSREQLQEMTKGPSWLAYNAKRMLEALDKQESLPTQCRAPLAVWQFGDDLTLVGLPGETVGGYVPLIQHALGPRKLSIAGYTNDCFGYLPTAKVLAEGGYETRGLIPEIGFFAPEAQQVVIDTVRQLAEKVGRKLPQ